MGGGLRGCQEELTSVCVCEAKNACKRSLSVQNSSVKLVSLFDEAEGEGQRRGVGEE